jgi:hypothetical protein
VLNSVLFIFSLFLIVGLLPPVQLYGSTILCDLSLNLTNCDERSSSSTLDIETTDNSRSDNTETPLIIPDISPTNKDLEDATTDDDRDTVTDATDEVNDDNDDDDNSENPDTDRDSSNSEGGSSDSKASLIPFP